MAQRWSTVEDRVLDGLYRQGVPTRAIARQLGRSEDAVSARRATLGLPARPRSRPWSPREDQLLLAATAAVSTEPGELQRTSTWRGCRAWLRMG